VHLSNEDLKQLHLGIDQFNEAQFFQCHETLEKLWLRQKDPEKELLQGLIQLAVGYHHIVNGNHNGGCKLLHRGLLRVTKYQPTALGLKLSDLCQDVKLNLEQLNQGFNLREQQRLIPKVTLL